MKKKINIKPLNVSAKPPPVIRAKKLDLAQTIHQQPAENPLEGLEYTGDMEEDASLEASALLDGFRQRARQEQDRFTLATDSEFWFAIGFQSREQKETFLQFMEWLSLGDKYLDGTELAAMYNIPLPPAPLSDPTKRQVDKRLKDLT